MPYKKKPKMGYKPKMQPPTSLMNSSGGWNVSFDPDEKFEKFQANKNKVTPPAAPDIAIGDALRMAAEKAIIGPSNSDTTQSQASRFVQQLDQDFYNPERPTSKPTPKPKPATKPKPQPSKSLSKMKTISTPSVSGGGSKTVGVREIDSPSNFKTYDLNRLGQMSRKEFGKLKEQKKMSDKGYGDFDSMKAFREKKREMRRGERRARKLGS